MLLNFLIRSQLIAKIGSINASVGITLKKGIKNLFSRILFSRLLSGRSLSSIYSGGVYN